jgi:ubiquinone/menaquinone biosynthesis C-methylase UbiE
MNAPLVIRGIVGLLALLAVLTPAGAQDQNDRADAARLVEVLQLATGSTVADIGAGTGVLTVLVARGIGAAGRVYSTDINPDRLKEILASATTAELQNVTVLEGSSSRTNLPDGCCDGVFMRHVYHHIAEPPEINASILRSLRPGGRLAIVDFPPRSGRTSPAGARGETSADHGVSPQTVIEELRAAGFIDVEQKPWPSPGYYLVTARRAP